MNSEFPRCIPARKTLSKYIVFVAPTFFFLMLAYNLWSVSDGSVMRPQVKAKVSSGITAVTNMMVRSIDLRCSVVIPVSKRTLWICRVHWPVSPGCPLETWLNGLISNSYSFCFLSISQECALCERPLKVASMHLFFAIMCCIISIVSGSVQADGSFRALSQWHCCAFTCCGSWFVTLSLPLHLGHTLACNSCNLV